MKCNQLNEIGTKRNGVNTKIKVFCNEFVVTGNQSEAYRRAFDTENMKPETINNEAYKLMQRHDVTTMVDTLKEGIAVKYEITVDDLVSNRSKVI